MHFKHALKTDDSVSFPDRFRQTVNDNYIFRAHFFRVQPRFLLILCIIYHPDEPPCPFLGHKFGTCLITVYWIYHDVTNGIVGLGFGLGLG